MLVLIICETRWYILRRVCQLGKDEQSRDFKLKMKLDKGLMKQHCLCICFLIFESVGLVLYMKLQNVVRLAFRKLLYYVNRCFCDPDLVVGSAASRIQDSHKLIGLYIDKLVRRTGCQMLNGVGNLHSICTL